MYHVEFFGGPCDGHQQTIASMPDPFVCVVSHRAKLAWWQRLRSILFRQNTGAVSVAVYELEQDLGEYRYRYVKTQLQAVRHDQRLIS